MLFNAFNEISLDSVIPTASSIQVKACWKYFAELNLTGFIDNVTTHLFTMYSHS